MDQMVKSAIMEAWKDTCTLRKTSHTEEVSRCAQHRLLDAFCLDYLLTHFSRDNISTYFNDYTEQVMDGMFAGPLIHQYLAVYKAREETRACAPIREFHEDIF